MEPSSLTKMNNADAEVPFLLTGKNPVSLNTVPVGLAPSVLLAEGGIATTRELAVPSWLYSVETPVPLSLTQIVPLDPAAIPHGLTRCGSVCCATPAMSDWKFVHE